MEPVKKTGPILPLRLRTRPAATGVGATLWLAAMVSVYVVMPQAGSFSSGRNLWDTYAVFQAGSHLGNLVAGCIFTLCSALVPIVIRRSRLGAVSGALAACGLIGLGIYYSAAVMGFGMAHVVASEGEAAAQGGLAMNLVPSGGNALPVLPCRLQARGRSRQAEQSRTTR
ncbi:hypothetical protein [Paeniglutamicibacter psychrophenolicus]|uniref:hypothetical protein n=1 Tax=Paeniglutamicibacter psychrophenolicus TaxID=257454 RepID=UPI00277DC376|nr:hypothetical protein [Paeniglutamicibacter psychrophenolicus]MDQ0093473.1 hypothetical protein [Paeniglutamicibacter psychrophenolicus]